MSLSPRRGRECLSRVLIIVIVTSVSLPAAALNVAGDEIPHENYDYVNSDLGVLVSLLNTSILYFESSFLALYSEDTDGGSQNLSAVNSLLGPAEGVLNDLMDVAASYQDLSDTIPPFAALADEEAVFIGLEVGLLEAREVLRSLSGRTSLTDNESALAMTAFNDASSLMSRMNTSIDLMLVSADRITYLSIEGEYPFADSNLVELIERLRDLLYEIEVELVELVEGETGEGGVPGIEVGPFLTLWILDTSVHLGDDIVGGGYLFYNGSFRSGAQVEVLMNGSILLTATTTGTGSFSFSFEVPLTSSWLGWHELVAFYPWLYGNLTSDPIVVSVSLIPTFISIAVSDRVLSPMDSLEVSVSLRDDGGDPVADAEVSFSLDNQTEVVVLDSAGRFETAFAGSALGTGVHILEAAYDGSLPYAPSISQPVSVKVDIPTHLELNLYSDRVYLGYYIVGTGNLTGEIEEYLSGKLIVFSIDGYVVHNATTDRYGGFAFSIPSESLSVGEHVLRAEFSPTNLSWRGSWDEAIFTIYATEHTAKYPFWPLIPGWGGLGAPPEIASNLFFGQYAYFGWLLVVSVIAIVVKTLRMRRAALAKKAVQAATLSGVDAGAEVDADVTDGISDYGILDDLTGPPDTPNERIVWSYNHLLAFLARNRRIQILASMTHREIARILEAFGYPSGLVNKVTSLFEMARYSGTPMTESEMAAMESVVEQLKSAKLGGGRRYAA